MPVGHRAHRWIVFWALWPFCLLLVAINFFFWLLLYQAGHPHMIQYVAISASISVAILAVFLWVTHHRGLSFLGPMRDLVHAGNWVLQTALGRSDGLTAEENAESHGVAIRKDLEQWLRGIKRDLYDGAILQSAEMARDLELARDFQMAHLNRPYPHVPAIHVEGRLRLQFYHRYEPALALGGDFFDILPLGPDSAGIFIADVMGHGTRSALITAILRTQIRDLALQGRNARHFMEELNQQFCRMVATVPHPLFASSFYFLADTTARVATYSSAGHPPPFHIRRGPERVGQVGRLHVPEPRGAALGLMRKEKYSGGHCRLIPGDVFLFFTDGLYEAHNSRGEEFGMQKLYDLIRSHMYKGVKDMVNSVLDGVYQFIEGEAVADDICLVAVEVTDKPDVSSGDTIDLSKAV